MYAQLRTNGQCATMCGYGSCQFWLYSINQPNTATSVVTLGSGSGNGLIKDFITISTTQYSQPKNCYNKEEHQCHRDFTTMLKCSSCCMRYQSRKVLSRPVVLILLWNCMVWITFGTPTGNYRSIIYAISQVDFQDYKTLNDYAFYMIPQVLWLISAFASAYLVGWKCKLADMVLIGVVIVGLGIMLDIALSVILMADKLSTDQSLTHALEYLPKGLKFIGSAPVMTILLQLGIEQVPEASAAQISAFVSWFTLSMYLGSWINKVIYVGFTKCFTPEEETKYLFEPYLLLCGAVLFTIILCSHFAFSHILLDNSPVYNSARTIYSVLKYAAKHKFPENRSSLTYWEDEPLSRINFGKIKYGGPFSS